MGGDGRNKELTYIEASSVIAGYGIGGGIMAVPYLISRTGMWSALLVLVVAYAVSVALHLMIAELAAGDGRGSQIVELFDRYLFTGKRGPLLTWIFFVIMGIVFLTNLTAYVSGGGEVLSAGAGVPQWLGNILFYAAAAFIAAMGLKVLGVAEKWAVILMTGLFVVLSAATLFVPLRLPDIPNRMDTGTLALYGMLMFCFASFFSVPQAAAGLSRKPRLIPLAVITGIGINLVLILLVSFMAILASKEVTEIAVVGWSAVIGNWAGICGTVFVVLAMLTSYWSISFALATIVRERTKWGTFPAWALATIPTLVLSLLGLGGFLSFMRTAGGGIAVLVAVLLVPTYRRYRKTRSAPAILPEWFFRPAVEWTAAVGYILMAVGSLVPM